MRKFSKLALLSAAALVGSTAVAAAPVSSGVGPPAEDGATFEFTGEAQDFTVPADVCSLTIYAAGGAGGGATAEAESDAGINDESIGGAETPVPSKAGIVEATIAVTPGETLQVNVGGAGEDGALPAGMPAPSKAAGGWPDGGDGAVAVAEYFAPEVNGVVGPYADALAFAVSGGGGGSTDVRRGGTALANRVVVAGGGGGLGAAAYAVARAIDDETANETAAAGSLLFGGGDGGGESGGDGDAGTVGNATPAFTPALGGSQTAGGTGGPGGEDGALGQGGAGTSDVRGGASDGVYEGDDYAFAFAQAAAAGGGGGGYFGGGGGGADTLGFVNPPTSWLLESKAGGGGGGSGFGPAGADLIVGANAGDGFVELSWTVDPSCDGAAPADAIKTPIRFTG